MGTFCAKPRNSDQLSSPPPVGQAATGWLGSSTSRGASDKCSGVLSSTSKASSRRWCCSDKDAGGKTAPGAECETLDGAEYRSLAQSDKSTFMVSFASVASNVVTAVRQQVTLSGLMERVAQTPGGQDSTDSTLIHSGYFTADCKSVTGDSRSGVGDRSVAGSSAHRRVVGVHDAEDSGVDDSDESFCYGNPHTAETRDGVTLIRVGTKANKPASRQSSSADSVEAPAADSTRQSPPDDCVGPEVSSDNMDAGSDVMLIPNVLSQPASPIPLPIIACLGNGRKASKFC